MFDRLVWKHDHMLLDDLVFRLEHVLSEDWQGGDHFRFHKVELLVNQYRDFFARIPTFRPQRIMELGIFDGGSTAFWFELFRPRKLVAADIEASTDSRYFRRFVESRGAEGRIRTHWATNQADRDALQSIVEAEFDGPLDLVIDDASHLYAPTRSSFETLFPRLTAGGLYVIEDWAWDHWPAFSAPDHPWANEVPLTKLISELIEAAGTSFDLIGAVTIYSGFAVVERGSGSLPAAPPFNIDDHVFRRRQAR